MSATIALLQIWNLEAPLLILAVVLGLVGLAALAWPMLGKMVPRSGWAIFAVWRRFRYDGLDWTVQSGDEGPEGFRILTYIKVVGALRQPALVRIRCSHKLHKLSYARLYEDSIRLQKPRHADISQEVRGRELWITVKQPRLRSPALLSVVLVSESNNPLEVERVDWRPV